MGEKGLETAAYYIALLTIVSVPPGIFLWILVHPFAHLWRTLGHRATYFIVIPILLLVGKGIYSVRKPLLEIHYGVSVPLTVIALLFFMAGIYIGVRRMRYLTLSVMLGVPELSRKKMPGRLFTEGIYGQVRHPRYIEIAFVLASIALLTNYLAVYILLAAYFPAIYIVVLLEERELRNRFDGTYESYCREVPRFFPKLKRHKNAQN